MIDSPSIVLAFAAGVVSFLSPCCLPLVPGYLAMVSGIGVQDVGRRVDARVLGRSLLFVATFSAVLTMGVLVLTGELFRLNIEAQRFLDSIGLNFFQDV